MKLRLKYRDTEGEDVSNNNLAYVDDHGNILKIESTTK